MAYAYQATVTVPAPTGSHTDFTLVITGTRAQMATVANGGAVQNTVTRVGQTVPADLIISSDSAGTSLYNWGWDFYSATTGQVAIWVKIPAYSAGLTLYVSVGNAAVNTYQGGAQGAEFDANRKGAWHLPNGTVLSGKDFSSNANDGTLTNTPTAVAAQVDGGGNFVAASSQYIDLGTPASLEIYSSFTVSVWIKLTPTTGTQFVYAKDFSTGARGFAFGTSNNKIYAEYAGGVQISGIGGTLSGAWHHLAWTVGAAANYTITAYVDGVSVGSANPGFAMTVNAAAKSYIGGRSYSGSLQPFDGIIDEVSIATAIRSSNWIATEYANQNNPPAIGAFAALVSAAPVGLPLMGCQ